MTDFRKIIEQAANKEGIHYADIISYDRSPRVERARADATVKVYNLTGSYMRTGEHLNRSATWVSGVINRARSEAGKPYQRPRASRLDIDEFLTLWNNPEIPITKIVDISETTTKTVKNRAGALSREGYYVLDRSGNQHRRRGAQLDASNVSFAYGTASVSVGGPDSGKVYRFSALMQESILAVKAGATVSGIPGEPR